MASLLSVYHGGSPLPALYVGGVLFVFLLHTGFFPHLCVEMLERRDVWLMVLEHTVWFMDACSMGRMGELCPSAVNTFLIFSTMILKNCLDLWLSLFCHEKRSWAWWSTLYFYWDRLSLGSPSSPGTRLTLNSQRSGCICLPRVGIKGIYYNTYESFLFVILVFTVFRQGFIWWSRLSETHYKPPVLVGYHLLVNHCVQLRKLLFK